MPGTKSSPRGAGTIAPRPGTAASRRRRNASATAAGGGLIAVTIIAFLLASLLGAKGSAQPAPAAGARPQPAKGTYLLPAKAVSRVEAVSVRALAGNAIAQLGRGQVVAPERLPPGAPRLSSDGHPEIMFICAEYWPQCAAERWALVMALAKFGTFSNLLGTTSSAGDADAGTPTFSFYGARYSSKYLALTTDELESNRYVGDGEYPLLQSPTRQEMSMISTWDVAPYTAKAGSIPFAYIGGKFIVTSAQYNAAAIASTSFATAAGIMTSGTSTVSRQVEAAAGYLVGDLCALNHDQPASVCSQLPASLIGITTPPAKASG
jgi:hypothetical protein